MYRAITLIELLITLAIIAIALYFIPPTLFRLSDHITLKNEMDNLQAFIYQVQNKARYQKKNYTLIVNQNRLNKQWCMVAVEKLNNKQIICNCFHLESCQLNYQYFLYQPLSQKIHLKSKSLYPQELFNISGMSARSSDKCLGLSLNNAHQVLQFKSMGVVYVIQNNKRTRCEF